MTTKVKTIRKPRKICKENKYDRQPNNISIQETLIPSYRGQNVHIDIYITEGKSMLTTTDKLTKCA